MKFKEIVNEEKLDEVQMARAAESFRQIEAVAKQLKASQRMIITKKDDKLNFVVETEE